MRVHYPNISIHHTSPEYRISIRTNSLGMRADRDFSLEKPRGVFRVVALGDSFTVGYEVEVEDTYLSHFERLLGEQGIKAEVLNLGVSGFGTAEQLIMLQERGLKFDPDLVIVGYYVNDIGDSTRSLLYSLNRDGKLVRKNKEYLPAIRLRDFLYSSRTYRFLAEHSHLVYFLRERISELIQQRMRDRNRVAESLGDDREPRLAAALLDEIKKECSARGITLGVLDIPSMMLQSNLPREFLNEVTADEIVDLRAVFQKRKPQTVLYW